MVTKTAVASPPPDDESYFEYLEASFADRPKRRQKRRYRRGGRLHVRSERLPSPDTTRMSKALLRAQRDLAQAQAEAEARQQATHGENSDAPT